MSSFRDSSMFAHLGGVNPLVLGGASIPQRPQQTGQKRVLEPGEICTDDEEEDYGDEDHEEDELEDDEDPGVEPGEIVSSPRVVNGRQQQQQQQPPRLEEGELPPLDSSVGPSSSLSSSSRPITSSSSTQVKKSNKKPSSSNTPKGNIPSNWAQKWTEEEDTRLISAIEQFGENNWKQVAQMVGTRDAGKLIVVLLYMCSHIDILPLSLFL